MPKIKIKPYPKNAKKHPDKQLKQIAQSIKEFGWQQPIVVDKKGVIIVGHGRWFAYKKYKDELKLPKPEIKTANLTEKQAKAYRLADNKLNESDWDMELAIEELKDLDEHLIELTGFEKDLLIEPDEKDDEVPEVPKKPKSKLGDLYELGNHRVLCGDATKKEDVEKLMDGKKADMYITDPPYNVDYTGKTKDALKIDNDKKDDAGFRQFIVDAFTCANTVMKAGAVFYIWHADSEGYNFRGGVPRYRVESKTVFNMAQK